MLLLENTAIFMVYGRTIMINKKVEDILNLQINKDRVYLSHFPMREWSGFYKNAYHLYGHCHGNIDDYKQSTDIGVDCWEYEPVSWYEVKQYIDENCDPNV